MLGPLLFLLYINDIHNASDKLKFYLFADDTKLIYSDKNLKSLETAVNEKLMNIQEWLTSNELSLSLTWKHHIIYIASKISKNIGIICSLRHFNPFSTLLNIYQ